MFCEQATLLLLLQIEFIESHLSHLVSMAPPYSVGTIEVLHTPSSKLDDPRANYRGLDPRIITLPKGHKKEFDCRAFDVETVFEKDVEIPMRDGTILRGDVFRPAGKSNLPAVIMFSPYGKSGTGEILYPTLESIS